MIDEEDGAVVRSADDPVSVADPVPANGPADAAAANLMYAPRSSLELNLHPTIPVHLGKNFVDSWKV